VMQLALNVIVPSSQYFENARFDTSNIKDFIQSTIPLPNIQEIPNKVINNIQDIPNIVKDNLQDVRKNIQNTLRIGPNKEKE